MEIIHYKKRDSKAVAAFFREIFKELGWEERESDYMNEPHKLFHLHDNGVILLVKIDNKLIGTAGIILLSPSEGLMKRFYINSEHRGTGVAQKLLHELIKKARLLGVKKIVFDVARDNGRAIRFYEKSGFTRMHTTPRDGWTESFTPEGFFYFYKLID